MRKIYKIIIAGTAFLAVLFSCFYVKYPFRYKKHVEYYAKRFHVEKSLVLAVIYCESSFVKDKVSYAGAVGLMQIMPSTAKYVCEMLGKNEYDLFDEKDNIEIGVKYLSYLFEKYKSEEYVLYAYNGGEGTLLKWLESGDKEFWYKESVNYYKKVERVKKKYKKLYG